MRFTKPWIAPAGARDVDTKEPALAVFLQTADGRTFREVFIVDSGADISMGPRRICDQLGLSWEAGALVELKGIAQRDECNVPGSVHPVTIFVAEAAREIVIPFCFAEGPAPLLLGREGFFDAFRIQFDKQRYLTAFEW
ncbi:MAG TPA: hypothetical protein VGY58_20570 [Gemmataceae bacterium]|jgi:hypothetical protein|nr:hypothetical protein [Gemmataceae bacterium]